MMSGVNVSCEGLFGFALSFVSAQRSLRLEGFCTSNADEGHEGGWDTNQGYHIYHVSH